MLHSVIAQSSLAEASILGDQPLLLAPGRDGRVGDCGGGGPGQWGSEQRTSLGKRYHLVIPHLPFPAVGPAPLTSKHQQRAQQGKFHGPRTQPWKRLLEVPFHAGSLLNQGTCPPPTPAEPTPGPPSSGSGVCSFCFLFLAMGNVIFIFKICLFFFFLKKTFGLQKEHIQCRRFENQR